jgi:hypothetical protein
MNQKDLIKYALIALGAYLIYEYIQKNGGLSGIFGTTAAAGGTGTLTAAQIAAAAAAKAAADAAAANTGGGAPPPKPPVLDMTGLTVVPDVNDSLTGVVNINGVPTKLSIITASGQIYDSTGSEITSVLQGEGIDVVALRTVFQNAAPPNLPPAPHPGLPCVQPNFFNPAGVCVSGNTQDGTYGQPVPGAAPRGVSGLGRVTPYWLM